MADERQDLLNAINSFLDCSIVLPPSEVGGEELLRSVARFQREMLRKREEQQGKELKVKEPKSPKDKGNRDRHTQIYIRILQRNRRANYRPKAQNIPWPWVTKTHTEGKSLRDDHQITLSFSLPQLCRRPSNLGSTLCAVPAACLGV